MIRGGASRAGESKDEVHGGSNVAKRLIGTLIAATFAASSPALAVDIVPPAPPVPHPPVADAWQYRFAPYGWLLYMDGDITARGRDVSIDTNIFEILDESDSILAWMSYGEARRGGTGLYLDLIWADLGFSDDLVAQRNPVAGLTISASADVGLETQLAIIEGGVAQEIARWDHAPTATLDAAEASFTALDVFAGARYWHSDTTISLDATATVDLPALGLTRTASGVVEAAQTMEWTDPLVGLRLRHQFGPGREFQLRGDVGGFGVGSDSSWQVVGAYTWEIGEHHGHMWHGAVGYRALSVDYSDGTGNQAEGFDVTLHGPIVGVSLRW